MFPFIRVFFVLSSIRILNLFWIGIGRLFSQHRSVSISNVDRIVINRSDRIGDAVLSKPFFILLARFLFEERQWKGKLEILVSGYNREILEDLSKIPGVHVRTVEGTASYGYERSIFEAEKKFFRSIKLFPGRLFTRRSMGTVFVDLVDSVTEGVEVEFEGKTEAYWMSANRGPHSLLFDFCLPERFAGASRKNLIEGYLDLFCEGFRISDFREYVRTNLSQFYREGGSGRSGIFVFAGVKEFRNVSTELWIRLIRALAEAFPNETVEVTDMKNHALLPVLRRETFPKNVAFVQNAFSFSELSEYARKKRFVLGVDGGDVNVLRGSASTAVIYTLWNPWVWSAFSWNREVSEVPIGSDWVLRSFEAVPGNVQMFLFKRRWFVPSFQIPVGKGRFDDLDARAFAEFVREKVPSGA